MPRRVVIVGAGQAGLVLGHALLEAGYDVMIVTNRSPDDVATGRILSNQCMWHDCIEIERRLGLAFWDDVCPPIPGFDTRIIGSDHRVMHRYTAPLSHYGQSIDQRLKFPSWIRSFTNRGGRLHISEIDHEELQSITSQADLTIIASGKGRGEMKDFFSRDKERSFGDHAERIGASIHVIGRERDHSHEPEWEKWAIIPGIGEFWIIPTLTVHGAGHILCLQGVPGGPLDLWSDANTPDQHVERVLALLRKWLPDEAERCHAVKLVDSKAWLSGGLVSRVSHPVKKLPNGHFVLAIADSFVLNDPISQQGSNNATRAAITYAERIIAHGSAPFDEAWMHETAAAAWNYARWTVRLTEIYLRQPSRFLQALQAPALDPSRARWLADTNNDVEGFVRFLDSDQ